MTQLYPFDRHTCASPIPVFPAVPSTIVPPGFINPKSQPSSSFSVLLPFSSASFITYNAALSLTDPPGFMNSYFSHFRQAFYQLFHRYCILSVEKVDSVGSKEYFQLLRQILTLEEVHLSRPSESEYDALSSGTSSEVLY